MQTALTEPVAHNNPDLHLDQPRGAGWGSDRSRRSRRGSSIRARIAAKSSAARGRVITPPNGFFWHRPFAGAGDYNLRSCREGERLATSWPTTGVIGAVRTLPLASRNRFPRRPPQALL